MIEQIADRFVLVKFKLFSPSVALVQCSKEMQQNRLRKKSR